MENNCMFQFYDGKTVVNDTGLITLDEAFNLFESSKSAFAKAIDLGRDCQMCIWSDCKHESDYRVAIKDWHSSNVKYDGYHFWVKE